jgi:hypothetical protein
MAIPARVSTLLAGGILGLVFGCSCQPSRSYDRLQHPALACTADELGRLQAALAGSGPDHETVQRVVREADSFLAAKLDFPSRGGQGLLPPGPFHLCSTGRYRFLAGLTCISITMSLKSQSDIQASFQSSSPNT